MSGNPEATTVIIYHTLSRSIAIRFIGTVNITYQHAKHQLLNTKQKNEVQYQKHNNILRLPKFFYTSNLQF